MKGRTTLFALALVAGLVGFSPADAGPAQAQVSGPAYGAGPGATGPLPSTVGRPGEQLTVETRALPRTGGGSSEQRADWAGPLAALVVVGLGTAGFYQRHRRRSGVLAARTERA